MKLLDKLVGITAESGIAGHGGVCCEHAQGDEHESVQGQWGAVSVGLHVLACASGRSFKYQPGLLRTHTTAECI